MGRAHRWVVVVPVVGCFAIAVVLAAAAAGCDGHGPAALPGDARADAPADAAICGPLDREIRDALADPGSCMTDSECDSVGGQIGFPTCDSASVNGVGAPTRQISRLDTRPARAPVPRFTATLTGADAGLGVVVGRYSFDVRLSHSLLSAG